MVDDGVIGSKQLQQHRDDNLENWTKMAQRHHTIKTSKMSVLPTEFKYLGHVVTEKTLRPSDDHVKAIKEMPEPILNGTVDVSGLRSFIGMVKYLRRYIPNCGHLCKALNELLSTDSTGEWRSEHQYVFDRLKDIIADTKGVAALDPKLPVYLCTDGWCKRNEVACALP